jgi:acyl carrier protein
MAEALTVQQIEDRVRKIVSNYLQTEPEEVRLASHFVDDLGADSLDLTELAVAFEDGFNLEIPDSDFGQITTVAGVVDYLKKRLIAS